MVNKNIKTLVGGKGDKATIESLAKKHNVSVDTIKKEVKLGYTIEKEHTGNKELQLEIILDHISDFKDYYSNKKYGLITMEKKMENESLRGEIKKLLRENFVRKT